MRKKYGGRVVFIPSQTFPPNINRRESTNLRQEKFLKTVLNMVANELKTDNFKDKTHKTLCEKIQVQTLKDCQDLSNFGSESEASEDLYQLCVDYAKKPSSKQKYTLVGCMIDLRNSYLYSIDEYGQPIKNPKHENKRLGNIFDLALKGMDLSRLNLEHGSQFVKPRHTRSRQMSHGNKYEQRTVNSRAKALRSPTRCSSGWRRRRGEG